MLESCEVNARRGDNFSKDTKLDKGCLVHCLVPFLQAIGTSKSLTNSVWESKELDSKMDLLRGLTKIRFVIGLVSWDCCEVDIFFLRSGFFLE